jgi:hypothetical protein
MTRHHIRGSEVNDHRRRDPIVTELTPPGRRLIQRLGRALVTPAAILTGIGVALAIVAVSRYGRAAIQALSLGVFAVCVIGLAIGFGAPRYG